MAADGLRRTPLYDRHVALGAKMVGFGGFEMPVQYTGINDEHRAVRSAAGIFDVSHMGEFRLAGPGSLAFLQRVTINDVATLEVGQAQYSAMCYSDGGLVDDLLVYRRSDHYLLVVNAANIDQDFEWLQSNAAADYTLENISDQVALLAVQGPASRGIVAQVLGVELDNLEFYHCRETRVHGRDLLVSRTGYSGELGFELYMDPETAPRLWDDLLSAGEAAGLQPAGLGARDTLRLEMKYCLYGQDITAQTNPIEAGLGWITKLDKGKFIGSQALSRVKEEGPRRRLVAFVMQERAIPRPGYTILAEDAPVGRVTSGTQSPTLNQGIGLGYVDRPFAKAGSDLEIEIRGKRARAQVVKPPLVKGTSLLA
ncbi:MAG: glycine cleavage system aminomethyltransferase GcvT [Candidatus Marinimicrobia bacterium]|nr:glycine cleavage system aminomethyltransferase GcvT [Candidatus Neomarinimicrobiota bacterium]